MSKILFYVHYNKNSDLHAHVLYQIKKIRAAYGRIVFISNSPLSSVHKNALSLHVDEIFERANVGFDFYAWKEAVDREGCEKISSYDSVTLMNDTCFGPLFDLEEAHARMSLDPCDFWGMINHRQGSEIIPELGINISEHVQSFFLVFKRTVVQSSSWRLFWASVECEVDVYQVIAKYEIGLTQTLRDAGFAYKVLLDTLNLELSREELSYVPVDYCLNDRLPFLKIKALLQHKNPRHVIGEIERVSNYPIGLIEEYISKDFQPDRSMPYCDKVLNIYSPTSLRLSGAEGKSIAIHVHVFYIDVWRRYVDYLRALDFPYALFITTDTKGKAKDIQALLPEKNSSDLEAREIVVLENRGRDILPWVDISEKLSDYDFVLHAHTKRSPTAADWVGASWQQDIFDTMLEQAGKIINSFQENPNLGIVIPDIPRYWRYVAPVRRETEAPFIGMMNDLWEKMRCEKKVDFENSPTFIMPYGTMFWYRPRALKKITSLALSKEVPDEPLPEKSVLHAIERLVVYVAWDAGFDYKIVPPKEIASGFADSLVRNQQPIQPPVIEMTTQHSMAAIKKDSNERGKMTLIRRAVAKLKILAHPKKITKMLTPYGMVRLYQKIIELRRAREHQMREDQAPLTHANQITENKTSSVPCIKSGDYWLRAHRHLHPMNIVPDPGAEKCLNLVISSLGRAQLFGGIATCTGVATVLARALDLPLRIITRDGGASHEQYLGIMSAMGIEPWGAVSFYSDSSRDDLGRNCPSVYSSDSDIFLASSWWTATALRKSVKNENVYHIIQEDELMFYQRGDDYLDCWSSLNAPASKYIVNSNYLHAWFKEAYPQIYKSSVVFDPVFSRNAAEISLEKKSYNLFFYARMTNPRNLFWFGVRVIDDCFKCGILDPDEWNIFFAGDDSIPQLEFFGGKKTVNLGILSWEEYKKFLQDVDLGLCLIHTPHPGYPVYDVASSGGVAVTNTLYTKSSFPSSANIIACDLSEDAFMDGMKRAAALAKDGSTRRENYLRQSIPSSWEESLLDVVNFVKRESQRS
ncbi:rhamnan synthesis F family protein [Variovorax paradoxus]|uniref:Rhamnan synthesis protein F n=1 Tax=Variovorax paradoxus TaxID=34073 RepID=A0A0H2LV19_VARPD|nr:rhamnan synthesis F family protein [Variovorax paradoxus]KLN54093.1 rhamnan synthesis protein F [Variovorax paradoxus]